MYKKPLAIIFSLRIDILSDTKTKQCKYHCCYKLILFDIIIKLWFFFRLLFYVSLKDYNKSEILFIVSNNLW